MIDLAYYINWIPRSIMLNYLLKIIITIFLLSHTCIAKAAQTKHVCESIAITFMHMSKGRFKSNLVPESSQYYKRFKNNILFSEIEVPLSKLNKKGKIDTEVDITSASSRAQKIKLFKQMKGVEEYRSSLYKTNSITLVDEEIDDFFKIYNSKIKQSKLLNNTIDTYVEIYLNYGGLKLLYLVIDQFLTVGLNAELALSSFVDILVASQVFFGYSFSRQLIFQRDLKFQKFLNQLQQIDSKQDAGYWHYASFQYNSYKEKHLQITSLAKTELTNNTIFFDRYPALLTKVLKLVAGNITNGSKDFLKQLWVGFDFLYYFDDQTQKKTLTIVMRSDDKKPPKTQASPASNNKSGHRKKRRDNSGLPSGIY